MATPNVGILTTTGKALIDKVNSGQAKISFSKVVFSSMDNSQLSDTQIKALTAIAPQEVVVSSPQTTLDTNSGETRIRATGTNEKLADGVYVKTYGVFAKDDTGNEILYGVTVSPNPNYFPAYDGVTPQAVTYSYKTVIQETSNITMTNSNDVYVSQEDLTEAIAKIPQPDLSSYDKTDDVDKKLQSKQDKLGFTAADDSKVVHTTDTIGGRNLLLGTSSTGVINSTWNNIIYVDVTKLIGVTLTYSCILDITLAKQGNVSASLSAQDSSGNTIGNTSSSNSIACGNSGRVIVTITIPSGASQLCINERTNNTDVNPYVGSRQLEKGPIATDWCPNPDDKVNVSDMRKPANDVAGIEEVNAKQDKIGYTPANDSKVAHLSGANNFDTVPTVNNNPLLLASSLPSDLARTSQQTNFTAGLRSGGVDVATAADLKRVKDSAWRPLTLENSQHGVILFKDNGDGTASLTGSATFVLGEGKTTFFPIITPPVGYTFTSLKWTQSNDGNSVRAVIGTNGSSAGTTIVVTAGLSNGNICFVGGTYGSYAVTFTPSELTTLSSGISCNPALVGI